MINALTTHATATLYVVSFVSKWTGEHIRFTYTTAGAAAAERLHAELCGHGHISVTVYQENT